MGVALPVSVAGRFLGRRSDRFRSVLRSSLPPGRPSPRLRGRRSPSLLCGPLWRPLPRRSSLRRSPPRPPRRSRPRLGSSSSRRRPRFPVRRVVTRGSSRPDPSISINSGACRSSLPGSTEVTSIPSMNCSNSTRRMSPTEEPPGTRSAWTEPFGCRAPAARHVQSPSSRVLVSSTSIRGMDKNASRPTNRSDWAPTTSSRKSKFPPDVVDRLWDTSDGPSDLVVGSSDTDRRGRYIRAA